MLRDFPENRILRQRIELWFAQSRRCYLCGGRIRDLPDPNPGAASRDHVLPKLKGGRKRNNLLLAHRACNQRKGARDPYPCEALYLEAINLMLEPPKRCR